MENENRDKEKKNIDKILYEKLYKILYDEKDILNLKKTKFLSKDNYNIIIQILNKLEGDLLINFMNYFNEIKIQMIKILFNGFIEFEFDDEEEKKILEIFSKIIGIYFNKKIFYLIYKKLSKQYRLHEAIKDNFSIKKFGKIMKIWKLLYDSENLSSFRKMQKSNSIITLLTKKNTKSENIDLTFNNDFNNNSNNQFHIYIYFALSPIHNLNKYNNDFYFLKVEDNNSGEFTFKYNHIFSDKNPFIFSEINSIAIDLHNYSYKITINNKEFPEKKEDFNFESISRMQILNYFFGQIESILVIKENLSNKKETIIEIKQDDLYNKAECKINSEKKNDNKIFEKEIKFSGTIFRDNYICNFIKNIEKGNKELNEIQYFGGFDCFIPLFKIIKYIINKIGEKTKSKLRKKKII